MVPQQVGSGDPSESDSIYRAYVHGAADRVSLSALRPGSETQTCRRTRTQINLAHTRIRNDQNLSTGWHSEVWS